MKKMLLITALAYLLQDVLNRRLLFKQTGSSTKKTITYHFFVSGDWAEENCQSDQNLWRRRKCYLKQKPSKHS